MEIFFLKPKISSKNVSICELPLAVGDCTRSFPRFYFNKATNKCYKFSYSGCEGNGNRFISKKQCRQRCLPKPKKKARLAPEVTLAPKIVDLCETCAAKNAECIKGQCVCRKGYEMKRNKCVDINECEWENCEPNALCVNTEGSFHCECKIGYAGSGRNCTMDHAVCGQNFDKRYETLCYKNTSWEIRYFYDQHNRQCRRFWYGGCQFSRSQNFFADAQTCLSICNGYHWDIYFSNVDSPKQISYVIATSTPSSSIPVNKCFLTQTKPPESCIDWGFVSVLRGTLQFQGGTLVCDPQRWRITTNPTWNRGRAEFARSPGYL
uniref:Uncharacterized protein n=1 Tax=Acrobeloides nanus TaxID=290746 RepID=A0A914DE19_9BILA